jgi:hypothetical protein
MLPLLLLIEGYVLILQVFQRSKGRNHGLRAVMLISFPFPAREKLCRGRSDKS